MKLLRISEKLATIPGLVFNAMLEKLGLSNDAALSLALEVHPSVISKIRNRKLPLGDVLLVKMLEMANLGALELYELSLGVPFGSSDIACERAARPQASASPCDWGPMYGIHRRTQKRRDTHSASWHVLVVRADGTHSKIFSDSRYGGESNALSTAQQFRDELLRQTRPASRKHSRQHRTTPLGSDCPPDFLQSRSQPQ